MGKKAAAAVAPKVGKPVIPATPSGAAGGKAKTAGAKPKMAAGKGGKKGAC